MSTIDYTGAFCSPEMMIRQTRSGTTVFRLVESSALTPYQIHDSPAEIRRKESVRRNLELQKARATGRPLKW